MEKAEPNLTLTEATPPVEPSDYERLVRFLLAPVSRFGLAIARYTDPRVRDKLIEQAKQDAQNAGVSLAVLDLRDVKPDIDLLAFMKEGAGQSAAACVVGGEHLLLDTLARRQVSPAISGLNRVRDLLPNQLKARVVLWLSNEAATALAMEARDLYDIALTFFEFQTREIAQAITRHTEVPDWLRLAPEADWPRLKREASLLEQVLKDATDPKARADSMARIGQIRVLVGDRVEGERWYGQAIEAYGDAGDYSNEAYVHLRLGELQEWQGNLDEAIKHYNIALEKYRQAGNEMMVGESLDLIANIWVIRRELDKALEIRGKELVPLFEGLKAEWQATVNLSKIADIILVKGHLDEALRIKKEQVLPAFEKLGNIRAVAVTWGNIADILKAQGQVDEALKIHQEQLPIFEQVGDVRETALAQGRIADILQARGQSDEALKIHQEQELPMYKQLGDIRAAAVTQGKIADILQARGQLDKALKIRQEQQLPVYEQLGDVRSAAATREKIVNTLYIKGRLDKALEIQEEQVLPVYEKLGAMRELAIGRTNTAIILMKRGKPGDRSKAIHLLRVALEATRKMQIPEAEEIAALLHQLGEAP